VKRKVDNSDKGSNPKESSVRGSIPEENLPLSLMSKGEIFIICKERKHIDLIPRGVMVTEGA
jgi:hypothetical protein